MTKYRLLKDLPDGKAEFYKYPKIRSIYWRDMDGSKQVVQGQYENETFSFLANLQWAGTLKLDGMNVGLVWDGHSISFQGRTEKTNFTEAQLDYLNSNFNTPEVEEVLEQQFGEATAVFYGELVGNGIQACGKNYRSDGYRFVVFDIYITQKDVWYSRDAVSHFAQAIGAETAPLLISGTLPELVDFVREKRPDPMANDEITMEGVVARPLIELKDNKGRVITKIKVRDVCG